MKWGVTKNNKSAKKMKNIFFIFLIFFFCFPLLHSFTYTPKAIAAIDDGSNDSGGSCSNEGGLYWGNENTIYVCPQKLEEYNYYNYDTYKFERVDNERDVDTGNTTLRALDYWKFNSVDISGFTGTQFDPNIIGFSTQWRPYFLYVKKTDPTTGRVTGNNTLLLDEVSIAAPEKGPKPVKKITLGKIWGKVYQGEGWKDDFAKIMEEEGNNKIELYYDMGSGNYSLVDRRSIDTPAGVQSDGSYYFESYSIDKLGGLLEGKYKLRFYHKETASAVTGKAKDTLNIGGTSTFLGEVIFNLKKIEGTGEYNRSYIGYGKISYLENTGTHEIESAKTTKIESANEGIFLDVNQDSPSLLEDALKDAIITFGDALSKINGWAASQLNASILRSSDIDDAALRMIWMNIRNISLGLLTLGILIIAFANILNIQIEQYGLSRMLPKLIVGVVMVYFSYFIALFLLDLVEAFQALMVKSMSDGVGLNAAKVSLDGIFGESIFESFGNLATFYWQSILLIILLIALVLLIVWVWLLMVVRRALLIILVAIVPLAFIMNIMPFTETYYKQWWAQFWKWAFIGPAIILMLFLGNQFLAVGWVNSTFDEKGSLTEEQINTEAANAGAGVSTMLNGDEDHYTDSWIYLALYGIMLFLAATIPLKMGKEIYGAVGNVTKKAGGYLGKKTGVSGALTERKNWVDRRDKARGIALRNEVAKMGKIGELAAGSRTLFGGRDEKALTAMREGRIKELTELHNIEGMNLDDVAKLTRETGDDELKLAGYRYLAGIGKVSGQIERGNIDARDLTRLAQEDSALANMLHKEDGAAWASMDLAGSPFDTSQADRVAHKTATASAQRTEFHKWTPSQYKILQSSPNGKTLINGRLANSEKVKKLLGEGSEASIAAAGDYLYRNPDAVKKMSAAGVTNEQISQLMHAAQDFKNNEGRRALDKDPKFEA